MSFLVVFNGQFSPHHKVERVSNAIPSVKDTRSAGEVNEFGDILSHIGDDITVKSKPLIRAYQQQEKSFQDQRKREHARDIMTSPVQVISENASISEAGKLFEKFGFRHLPVVNDNGIIVGMISDRELLNLQNKKYCHEIMTRKLIVSDELTSINEIAITLLNERMNALPIVNRKHELTGIITLTDILNYVIRSTPFLGSG